MDSDAKVITWPQAKKMIAEIECLTAEVARLREAVQRACSVFRAYAQLHREKGTPDAAAKARVNDAHADAMESALSEFKP